jgi:hypothetical protein
VKPSHEARRDTADRTAHLACDGVDGLAFFSQCADAAIARGGVDAAVQPRPAVQAATLPGEDRAVVLVGQQVRDLQAVVGLMPRPGAMARMLIPASRSFQMGTTSGNTPRLAVRRISDGSHGATNGRQHPTSQPRSPVSDEGESIYSTVERRVAVTSPSARGTIPGWMTSTRRHIRVLRGDLAVHANPDLRQRPTRRRRAPTTMRRSHD